MKEKVVDFDLSKLTFKELVKVYEVIEEFLVYVEETKKENIGDELDG